MSQSNDGEITHLYKYRGLRNGTDVQRLLNIIDGQLFAAGNDQFNDPFDCVPVPKFSGSHDDREKYLKQLAKKHVDGNRVARRQQTAVARRRMKGTSGDQTVKDSIEYIVESTGIISLSSKPDHLLMWGHYGSEYKGACLRFRRHKNSRLMQAFKVQYSELRPVMKMPIEDPIELMNNIFLTKADCWSYEEEWRVVEREGRGKWDFDPADLDAVIFGARCSEAHIEQIKRHLSQLPNRTIELLRAQLAPKEYKIEIVPLG